MKPNIGQVIAAMTHYNYGCPELVNHALKVYGFARGIGASEGISPACMEILETAAVLHDIGIRVSEEKYHAFGGKYQQIEGPAIAREMLTDLGFSSPVIERVCYLIAHHHEYEKIDGMDYQILVEADFLVNIFEENTPEDGIRSVRETVFRTATGKQLLDDLFCREPPAPSLFAADLERITLQKIERR
ncbi:MAG: HD domain-containing protein, partial [Oscillospiraceae bacterium]|nr:HD domain-containing protein [Oscillospiraceae bacterium]